MKFGRGLRFERKNSDDCYVFEVIIFKKIIRDDVILSDDYRFWVVNNSNFFIFSFINWVFFDSSCIVIVWIVEFSVIRRVVNYVGYVSFDSSNIF